MHHSRFASTFEDDESEALSEIQDPYGPYYERFQRNMSLRKRTNTGDLTRSRSQSLATSLPGAICSGFPGQGLVQWDGSTPQSIPTRGRSPSTVHSQGSITDPSNMSPFVRDVGQILLDDGSAFPVFAGPGARRLRIAFPPYQALHLNIPGGAGSSYSRLAIVGYRCDSGLSGGSLSRGHIDQPWHPADTRGGVMPSPPSPVTLRLRYGQQQMQRRSSDASKPLNVLGKGVPLHAVPMSWPLYIVEFKAGCTHLFYCTDLTQDIRVGDLVIVEPDRGQDLGKVVNDTITLVEDHLRSHIEIRSDLVHVAGSPQEELALFGAATDWLDGLNKQLDDWDSQSYISGFHQLCVKDKMTELGWPTRDYIAQIARFDPSKGISIVIDSYVCFRKLLTEKEPSGEPQQMLICGHGLPLTTSSLFTAILNALMENSKFALQLSTREGGLRDHLREERLPVRAGNAAVAQHMFDLYTNDDLFKTMAEYAGHQPPPVYRAEPQEVLRQAVEVIREVIRKLTARNIRVSILSGDHPNAVFSTAAELGIAAKRVRAGCLPAEKQVYIKELTAQGDTVLFCGDGTNDIDRDAVARSRAGRRCITGASFPRRHQLHRHPFVRTILQYGYVHTQTNMPTNAAAHCGIGIFMLALQQPRSQKPGKRLRLLDKPSYSPHPYSHLLITLFIPHPLPARPPTMIPIAQPHYDVFMSIFKGGPNARYELKEVALVKAMIELGFEFTDIKKGSRRRFAPHTEKAVEAFGNHAYVYHIVSPHVYYTPTPVIHTLYYTPTPAPTHLQHTKVLDTHRQDLLKKDLARIYGWKAETFILVDPASNAA
ncbi:hypothetical protein L226DRAFT_567214 [Lentinus tigrinus ALCF2SS1-7]|uniref:uncharacterized protein n=1 Tax=Lentinus tigrinus ALCF2SS1-7 TaxID=1328758 RepID=UPI0011660437|nr:hypothetical protein L226DRAFT_567214 [Lentinus tigrinus ALCF2SS1-7]